MKHFKHYIALIALTFLGSIWSSSAYCTESAYSMHSTGPLVEGDCEVLLLNGMTVRPFYKCSACGEHNAMTDSVTLCWSCQKPHKNELPMGSFVKKKDNKTYVRAVDIVPDAKLATVHVSRIECPTCGASNPGLDVNTGMAPERCANPSCNDSDDLDENGLPKPSRLIKNGELNRLVFREAMASLVVVPENVAAALDSHRQTTNDSEQLRAQIRRSFFDKYGYGYSVEEIDEMILEAMVELTANSVGLEDIDADKVIQLVRNNLIETELQMAKDHEGLDDNQVSEPNQKVMAQPTQREPIDQFAEQGGDRKKWVENVKKYRNDILLAAFATAGISAASLGWYGLDHTVWGATVENIMGNQVMISITTGPKQFKSLSFAVHNIKDMKIEVGDNVSVHGPRWFRFGGYTGVGFESGDYLRPNRD